MGWGVRPRRIRLLGKHLTANVSIKKLLKGEDEPVSLTSKLGFWSRNTRTERNRWSFPLGIFYLGRKKEEHE